MNRPAQSAVFTRAPRRAYLRPCASVMLRRALVHSVILSLLLWSCAPRVVNPPEPRADRSGIVHVVKPGETLFGIGKTYGIAHEELARVNAINDPQKLAIGTRLFIPGVARALPVETVPRSESAAPNAAGGERVEGAFLWPVSGSINSGFGRRGASFHDGVDIAAPEGTPIQAIDHGAVIFSDQLRGYGNIVIVRHRGGIVSVYAHNQVNLVREGQEVRRGEIVGRVGSTGRVTGPHLHFEIRKNNLAEDPLGYFPPLCCARPSDIFAPKG
jgi:murein DD-endopeptidase MepM/ murein hydrolase activator NlpD